MAKQNTDLMIATYTSDFGSTFDNLPVRWSTEAQIPSGFYANRVGGCAGGNLPFQPRYLKAQFLDGVHKYPVPNTGNILTMVTALIGLGAICIDLVGEKWNNVPDAQLGTPSYRTTPYAAADIDGTADKETGKFDYVSEVFGALRLGYTAEETNAALLTAQKSGLTNPEVGGLNSRPKNVLVRPRYFQIIALVDDDTTIRRKAAVSAIGSLATVGDTISSSAYYLFYQGESAKRLQDI